MNRPLVNFEPEAWVKLTDLKPHPNNPRVDLRENPNQFESLKESIEEGVFEPIKVSKRTGYCLAGNQRLKAFEDLGFEEVPVMYNDCATEREEMQVIIKDNNEWGAYDYEALSGLMEQHDFELAGLGLSEADKKALDKLASKREQDEKEDDVPSVPKAPKARLGELYQLGNHRLLCGDSTNPDHVARLMAGKKADMVFTDPPYNVDMTAKNEMLKKHGKARKDENTFGMQNDHMSREEFRTFLEKVFACYKTAVKNSAPFYVCHSSSSQRDFEDAMEKVGLKTRNQIIWNKTVASLGWGDYRWKHEPIFYATFDKAGAEFYGDRSQYTVWNESWDAQKIIANAKKMCERMEKGGSTVWTLSRDMGTVHPTQKPIELIEIALGNSSKSEDIILDLFGGSGSTLIACEKSDRSCFTMELDPKYVDVIIQRWEEYTELKAELIAD